MVDLNEVELRGLRAIEAVARHGTLRGAADELRVTPGAISQRVIKAEAQLGLRLFERTPQGLKPTTSGRDLAAHLTEGFAAFSRGLAGLPAKTSRLALSVAPVFAGKWLMPRLNRFSQADRNIELCVEATTELADPRLGVIDACIRVGRGPWPGLKTEQLFSHCVFPVCAPDVAECLRTPCDLMDMPIIREPAPMFGWDTWLEPHRLDANALQSGPVLSDASLCLDAARAGQGVFLAWEVLVDDDLASGRLVAPFAERRQTGLHYYLVTTKQSHFGALAEFRRWLLDEVREANGAN